MNRIKFLVDKIVTDSNGTNINVSKTAYYKMNQYPNAQQPGTLWYHDHAMSATSINVALGLFGFYVIRNEELEKSLPKRYNERFIIIHADT